jgi:hypothetical protein
MYGDMETGNNNTPKHGIAGSGGGAPGERTRPLRYEGQATDKRRRQAAACAQNMQHVPLQPSTTRKQEPEQHVDVSDSSSGSGCGRHAAGAAAHPKANKFHGQAPSSARPRSCIPTRVLNTPSTQGQHGARTGRPWLSRRAAGRPCAWPKGAAVASTRRSRKHARTLTLAPRPSFRASGVPLVGVDLVVAGGRRTRAPSVRRRARVRRPAESSSARAAESRQQQVSDTATAEGAQSRCRRHLLSVTTSCSHDTGRRSQQSA